jgi:hypothetical protein
MSSSPHTASAWQPHRIRRLAGDRYIDTPAQLQIPTAGWNRVVGMPYLIYMPEKQRLLMLVYLDYRPCKPAILTSDDFGSTWSAPTLVPTHPAMNPEFGNNYGDTGTSLAYLGRGRVMFCGVEKRWISDDFGQTWNGVPLASNDPAGKPWAGWTWEPPLVDLDDAGNATFILESAYSHEGDAYPAPGYFSQARIRVSTDAAHTWTDDRIVPQWKHVNEVAFCRAANGTLVAACRTDINPWYRDPSHRPDGLHEPDLYSGFGISLSHDNGQTWSPLTQLFDFGRHFTSMVVLPNHDIVMTYVVRIGYPYNVDGFPQFGIEAVVSRDHGQTWDLEHRLILDEWTGLLRGHCAWYPSPQSTSTVLLPDNSLLTVYGRAVDCPSNPDGSIGAPRDIGVLKWTL